MKKSRSLPIPISYRSISIFFLFSILCSLFSSAAPRAAEENTICIIITGLGGMPEYEENFLRWGLATEAHFRDELGSVVYRLDGRHKKKSDILHLFEQISSSPPPKELWLFLIGHASHDHRNYKFNISGPDLTDQEIKTFFDGLSETRTYLIAATSASGTLASQLGQENRVIVTATKSATERQPPLFMSFFLEAVTSEEADTDKNARVSLLEAFLFSHQKVAAWFEEKGRIQTEHSTLQDNGQVLLEKKNILESHPGNQGTLLASMAYLSRATDQPYRTREARELASQGVKLEREIEDLKFRKNQMPEDEYYRALEDLLVKLAILNESIAEMEGEL
ncbi:MAG: hypothetical protein IH937_11855 [Acidobacteria bacterium]|nr:hypothetical protein [Acidobacteriota bacterium]